MHLQNTVRNFSRYNRYSTGADLRDLSRRILLLIIRVNYAGNKNEALRELVETCDLLKTILVFIKTIKAVSGFATISPRQLSTDMMWL